MDIYNFLTGKSTDYYGRSIKDIHNFDYQQLENIHNYIQWIFPTFTKSQFYPNTPILDNIQVRKIKNSKEAITNIRLSFFLMIDFYGLELTLNKDIKIGKHFESRKGNWLELGNHNHLRITRILNSLKIMGFNKERDNFLNVLLIIKELYPNKISSRSVEFWKKQNNYA